MHINENVASQTDILTQDDSESKAPPYAIGGCFSTWKPSGTGDVLILIRERDIVEFCYRLKQAEIHGSGRRGGIDGVITITFSKGGELEGACRGL